MVAGPDRVRKRPSALSATDRFDGLTDNPKGVDMTIDDMLQHHSITLGHASERMAHNAIILCRDFERVLSGPLQGSDETNGAPTTNHFRGWLPSAMLGEILADKHVLQDTTLLVSGFAPATGEH